MKVHVWGSLAALSLAIPLSLTGPASAAPVPAAQPFDVNGDGFPELVVGAPLLRVGSVKEAGGVVVLPASKQGLSRRAQVITQSSPGVAGASEESDQLGYAVASADFNRDGYADLAIGAPGEDASPDDEAGAVTIVYGSASGLSTETSSRVVLTGTSDLGASLAAADFTGDGYPDLAVGSPGEAGEDGPDPEDVGIGTVHVLRGGQAGLTTGTQIVLHGRSGATRDTSFGELLAAGDLDGDGISDVVVGDVGERFIDDGYPGSVSVCLGRSGGPSGCARLLQDDHLANMSALAVGDVVGSSTPEIVVGSYLWNEETEGLVNLLQVTDGQPTTLAKRTEISAASPGIPGSASEDDSFGASLALGDLDSDGHGDLVIGSPGVHDDSGRVTVVHGGPNGYATSGNRTYDQSSKGVPGKSEAYDSFGGAVTLLDHDGDGRPDLSVGVPGENTDDGAVITLKGSGTSFTTSGATSFTLDSLGYPHPKNGLFGAVVGVAGS